MGIIDDRPKRSLSGSILRAVSWLAVYYFAGQLVRQYVPPEVFQLLPGLFSGIPPIIFAFMWIGIALMVLFTVVIFTVVISRMPRE
jgi:polyferredoxin